MPSGAGAEVLNERATPQPTVLSRVWEGPVGEGDVEGAEHYPLAPDVDVNVARSRLLGWLLAPATRRRALVVTTVAALACGALLAVGEMEDRGSETTAAQAEDIEVTRGSLSSSAVADDESVRPADFTDGSTEEAVAARGGSTDAATALEALSADERLRLEADPLPTAAGGWMLEAQPSAVADSTPVVRFTVNGVVVAEVESAPYRLQFDPELVASFPDGVVEGQPLIVTASALWPDGGEAAGPATVVLPAPPLN